MRINYADNRRCDSTPSRRTAARPITASGLRWAVTSLGDDVIGEWAWSCTSDVCMQLATSHSARSMSASSLSTLSSGPTNQVRTTESGSVQFSRPLYMQCVMFCQLYTRRSDVTESVATIRAPFCGYNLAKCVQLLGEDLPCYSNKI